MQYKNEVENQHNKKIKVLRSDSGGKYESPFGEFCLQHGIVHQTTAPYSSQQNGVAKRKNRTLKDMMNAMLLSFGLPQIFPYKSTKFSSSLKRNFESTSSTS